MPGVRSADGEDAERVGPGERPGMPGVWRGDGPCAERPGSCGGGKRVRVERVAAAGEHRRVRPRRLRRGLRLTGLATGPCARPSTPAPRPSAPLPLSVPLLVDRPGPVPVLMPLPVPDGLPEHGQGQRNGEGRFSDRGRGFARPFWETRTVGGVAMPLEDKGLEEGVEAPGFELREVGGGSVALGELLGEPVIVLFYRGSW